LAVALLVPAGSGLAGPSGELDASFGNNGRTWLEGQSSDWHWGIGHAIALQPDGKILVAGEEAYGYQFLIHRLNSDGSRDDSFGDGGSVLVNFHSGTQNPGGEATAIAVQPDGRIIVGGLVDGSYGTPQNHIIHLANVGLVRLHPDGSLDSSFGTNGRVILDFGGGREYLSDLVLLPAGEIVIAGSTNALGDADMVFARLTPAGNLDPTFGSGPMAGVTIARSGGHHQWARALVRQDDGSLTACGLSRATDPGVSTFFTSAARVFANGSIDTGFGGGMAHVDAGLIVSDCLAMPDGSVVLGGYGGPRGAENLRLAWLGPDGRLATQHGQNGLAILDLGGSESIQGMTHLTDGSIAVTGLTGTLATYMYGGHMPMYASPFPSTLSSDMLLAKLDAYSGQLDSTFGDAGVTRVDFGRHGEHSAPYGQEDHSWAYARAIIETADGKLVAMGTAIGTDFTGNFDEEDPDIALARVDLQGAGNPGLIGFASTYIDAQGASSVIAPVRRTGGSTAPVVVDYRTVPGTATAPGHFTPVSGTLAWNHNETGTKTIQIPVNGLEHVTGYFWLVLENATAPLAADELKVSFRNGDNFLYGWYPEEPIPPLVDSTMDEPADDASEDASAASGTSGSSGTPAPSGTSGATLATPVPTAGAGGGGGALGLESLLLLVLAIGSARLDQIRRRAASACQHPTSHSVGCIRASSPSRRLRTSSKRGSSRNSNPMLSRLIVRSPLSLTSNARSSQ
jgi:uncharacterized delta-60 repeat protein